MKNFPSQSLYETLNVAVTADSLDLRRAYRNAALRTHPDKPGGSEKAFHSVGVAFEVLSCRSTRLMYDRWLSQRKSYRPIHQPVRRSDLASRSPQDSTTTYSQHFGPKQPPAKRRRTNSSHSTSSAKHVQMQSHLRQALELVRSVLEAMNPSQRRTAFSEMSSADRTQLLKYMECAGPNRNAPPNAGGAFRATELRRSKTANMAASSYGVSKIYTCHGLQRTRYQANIQVMALRLYTREQSCLRTAMEHQIVLVGIKQALNERSEADQHFWYDYEEVTRVCKMVLHEHATSEAELGLRAWVHMRVPKWLGARYRVGSMATNLASAAETHSRLIKARAMSWQAFRREWVQLIQIKKHVSEQDAEDIADRRRYAFLKEDLGRALAKVELVRLRQKSKKETKNSMKSTANVTIAVSMRRKSITQ